jgi:anti-sigma regulatory factor (Ser/Thr protein kinase)
VVSLELQPDHTAAVRARRFVTTTLHSWQLDDLAADAQLLVSELVTNAVLHARSVTRVEIVRTGDHVRVSVCDTSASQPRVRDYGPDAVTGRGMLLVDRIAQRWGVRALDEGKCVWFEIDARGQDEYRAEGSREVGAS